jgi:glycosyltransferase involved in cell wall biosynthesis
MIADVGKPAPDISIIIRSKNEERCIGQTLSAIFQQRIDIPFEVIVIDSGSTDRTLDIVRRHAVRLYEIETQQFTYGRALNYGSSLARGQYLINLSAHCIPTDSNWMARLIDSLRCDSRIAATYGGQVPMKGVNPFEERTMMAVFMPDNHGRIRSPFSNANCSIRKNVWEMYPFDETASFAEDYIWSKTLPTEHKITYVPDAAVYHTHPLHLKYWAKRSYDSGVLVQYIKHVYGLQYHWATSGNSVAADRLSWKRFFRMLVRPGVRCLKMIAFLLKNRYLRFVPILPVYSVIERYYYRKGLADGNRLYGRSERPVL